MGDAKLLQLFSGCLLIFGISDQFSTASDFGCIIDPAIAKFYSTTAPRLYAIVLRRKSALSDYPATWSLAFIKTRSSVPSNYDYRLK